MKAARFFLPLPLLLLFAGASLAMSADGCGAGKCSDCHTLTVSEAATLFRGSVDRVLSVDFSEMPGVWVVEVEKGGNKFPVYIDFSKSYVVTGSILRLKDGQDISKLPQAKTASPPKPAKVDVAKIPVGDALLLGRAEAKTKVIVFTDPECPYCKTLHAEMREVVRRDPEIAFLIKLFPLKIHPNAYSISKSILCLKSLPMLEASFEGKPVPPPLCETSVVDETLALGASLGINSTPTLVLPDGRLLPGSRKADDILQQLGSRVVSRTSGK